jgi:hypothetical protein
MTNEIIFKTRVDTGTTSKDLAAISTELGKIDEGTKTVGKDSAAQLEALNAKIKAGGMSARELSRSVQEYMTIARDAGRDSPIGQQAIADAAKLTDELTDLRNEIKRASHDGANMQAALQLGSTVIAGYGAAKGAMSLLGVESESLQESMVKLQAATATLNGLEQIRAALEKESFLMMKAKAVQTNLLTAATAAYSVAVGSSTGALRLFRLALIATGIGAIIVGIGLLIANFDKVTGAVKNATDKFNSLGDGVKNVLSILFPFIGAIRLTMALLEKMGIIQGEASQKAEAAAERQKAAYADMISEQRKETDKRISDNERLEESIETTYDFEIAKAKAAGKDTTDLERKKRAELRATYLEQLKNLEMSARLNVGNAEKMKKILDQVSEYRKNILKVEQAEELATISEGEAKRKKAAEAGVEAEKKRVDAAAKELERERVLRDYFIQSIADDDVRALVQLQENHKREEEELIKKYGNDTELIKALQTQQNAERLKLEQEWIDAQKEVQDAATLKAAETARRDARAALELRLVEIQEDWAAEMEVKKLLWEMERDLALQNEDLTENEKLLIKAQYSEKVRQLQEEDTKRSIELAKQDREAINEIMANGMKSIQGLSDTIFAVKLANAKKGSEEELRIQKKQFELNKAMQLGTAIINGVQSILAITSVPDFTLGVQTALRIGAQVALNAASIAKIASQRFEGGAPSPFTPPAIPQVGAPDTTNAQPQAQGTQTAGLTNQSNKVVVVDSEIKAVMDGSQQIEVVSSFGG